MPHQTEPGQLSIKSLATQPRQARFVDEYLIDLNATQAAIRAGYSPKTAQEQGSRLLSNVIVQDAVAEAMAARSERTEVMQDMVVQELARLAFSNMADYATWGPNGVTVKSSEELPPDAVRAVSEITETITKDGRTIKFKLHDKRAALVDLGRHLGMFIERKEIALKGEITFRIGKGYVDRPDEPEETVVEGEVKIVG